MMIEFAVCMIALQAKLASKLDNERKSNNGVTNEIGVRKMRAKTRGGRTSVHLQPRVHVLSRMQGRDESGLSELRRGIGAATEGREGRMASIAPGRVGGPPPTFALSM